MGSTQQAPLVLVVDDDDDLRALVCRWLELSGMRTSECGDAEAFLDRLDTSLPDAVCLDINLPGLSGLDALDAVNRQHPSIPVLMLTAETAPASVVDAMNRGAFDYLTKPLERTKLVSAVTHAVRLEQARHEVAHLRKGADTGQRSAREQSARGRTFCRGELCRDSRITSGLRAFRPRARRLHRGSQGAHRVLRTRQWGDAVSG